MCVCMCVCSLHSLAVSAEPQPVLRYAGHTMMMTDESTPLSLPPLFSSVSSCHSPLFSPLCVSHFYSLSYTDSLSSPCFSLTFVLSSCHSLWLFVFFPFVFSFILFLSFPFTFSAPVFSCQFSLITIYASFLFCILLLAVPESILLLPSISFWDGS